MKNKYTNIYVNENEEGDWFFSCKVFLVVHCSRYEKIMIGKFLQQRRRTLEKKLQH